MAINLTAHGRTYVLERALRPNPCNEYLSDMRFRCRITTPSGPEDPCSGLRGHTGSLTFYYNLRELIMFFDLVEG
jgi:hypothetical protein